MQTLGSCPTNTSPPSSFSPCLERTEFKRASCALAIVACVGILGCGGDAGSPTGGLDPTVDPAAPVGGGGGTTPSAVPTASNGGGAGSGANPEQLPVDPGSVTLRRLNRAEYQNTVKDLLDTTTTPSLPEEGILYGFDNVAEAMALTPEHFIAYESSARSLVDEALDSDARTRTIACEVTDSACRSSSLDTFMRRAWRRPASSEEHAAWLSVYNNLVGSNATPEQAFRSVLAGVMTSPHFIYRVELDPDPTSVTPHPLTGYELATRLSYFLWSSMPDDQLLDAAASGLTEQDALRAQVSRMLSDEKARAFIDNFAGQWLKQRHLIGISPSTEVYPTFDEQLSLSAQQETWLFFEHILKQERPLSELLTADYSFWDQRLTSHYGNQGEQPQTGASDFQQISLPAERQGLLTHASILLANAEPDRSSAVKRGVWLLSNLLCLEPPPPPAVLDTEEFDNSGEITNQRERLALHASKPECASCHALFDPAGFAFENYDGIGRYRTTDNGAEIDATGSVVDLDFVDGIDFANKLAADPRFEECLVEKMFIYGVGRNVMKTDRPYLELIQATAGSNPAIGQLIEQLILSDLFRMRRGARD